MLLLLDLLSLYSYKTNFLYILYRLLYVLGTSNTVLIIILAVRRIRKAPRSAAAQYLMPHVVQMRCTAVLPETNVEIFSIKVSASKKTMPAP